ncbi:MAG: OprO/OprP family phosphate-selective porin, partial [Magnetococcus sp. YQC-5]
MFKKTGYTLALLSLAVPTADLFAADPSNAELYKMIMDLKKELVATKSENKELRNMIDKQSAPVSTERGSLSSSGGTAKSSAGAVDTSAPVQHKEIPLAAKNKDSYLILESADGGIQYKLDGRIMLDAGFVSDNEQGNAIRPDMEVRRARFSLKTTLYKDWSSEFDLNLVSDKSDTTVTSTSTSKTTGKDSTGGAINAATTTTTKSS